MKRVFLKLFSFCVLSGVCVTMQPVLAQNSRTDKVQTYVMPNPYPVEKIVSPEGKKVKNVILMIGDGMSLMHVYSAWTANRGKLYLENCPVVGLSKTYCANKLITDSGAGGTAMLLVRRRIITQWVSTLRVIRNRHWLHWPNGKVCRLVLR